MTKTNLSDQDLFLLLVKYNYNIDIKLFILIFQIITLKSCYLRSTFYMLFGLLLIHVYN